MVQTIYLILIFAICCAGVNGVIQNIPSFGNNNQGIIGGFEGTGNAINFGGSSEEDVSGSLEDTIPGIPGQDYPVLQAAPNTGFTCVGQIPGYYADTAPEAGCQVFHICEQGNRMHSFLCPVGTIFNQKYFVCDWWYNVQCGSSDQFFQLNSLIGRVEDSNESGGNFGNDFGSFTSPNNGNVGNAINFG